MPAHAAPRSALRASRPLRRAAAPGRGRHRAPRRTPLLVPGIVLTAAGGSFVALSATAAPGGVTATAAPLAPSVPLPAWTGVAPATPAVARAVVDTAAVERASRSARPAPEVVRPVDGPVTSGFGRRWGRLHAGLDFGVPVGTPVRAAQAGTVQSVTYDAGGYGKHVVLVHPDGTTTLYGHLSQVLVTGGQVAAGQVLALSGNTGHSTGPHLHFEVRGADGPVDPALWLAAHGVEP